MEDLKNNYRKAAREIYHDPGHIEIDDPNAEVSISDDEDADGVYVQAWVFVSTQEMEYLRDNAKAVLEA